MKRGFLLLLCIGLFVSASTLAAPPRKDICPAPADHGQWRAAANRGCAYFGETFSSLGGHSAFAPDGSVITCIHFSCRAAPAKPDVKVQLLGIDNRVIDYGARPWTWVRYRVTNAGATSVSQPVLLRVVKNGRPSSGYLRIDGPIPAGGDESGRFAVGHDSGWPRGDYVISLEADYRNQIDESHERNNQSNRIRFQVR